MFGIPNPLLGGDRESGLITDFYPLGAQESITFGVVHIVEGFLGTPTLWEDLGEITLATVPILEGTLEVTRVPIEWTNNRDFGPQDALTLAAPAITDGSLTVTTVLVSYTYQRDSYPDRLTLAAASITEGTLELRGIHYTWQTTEAQVDRATLSTPTISDGTLESI